jgi:hypothetical protein
MKRKDEVICLINLVNGERVAVTCIYSQCHDKGSWPLKSNYTFDYRFCYKYLSKMDKGLDLFTGPYPTCSAKPIIVAGPVDWPFQSKRIVGMQNWCRSVVLKWLGCSA